ncbi:TPA: hypothetical protein ACIRVE_005387 [Pseudomonas putida]
MSNTLDYQDISADVEIQAVLKSQEASHWLKQALEAALSRDFVDVANDAEVLRDLLDRRAFEKLGLTRSR